MDCSAEEDCKRPGEDVSENDRHTVAGYGMYEIFHPECCNMPGDCTSNDHENV